MAIISFIFINLKWLCPTRFSLSAAVQSVSRAIL
nr:MAG TPA: hypothetical protein [Caudoviricetes sp.]